MLNDDFNDLSEAMILTTTLMQENLEKADCLYDALKLNPDFSQLTNMITILEQAFYNVEKYAARRELRNLHLLNYVQFISCLEQSGMTALLLISKSQRHGKLFEKLDQCLVPVIMESNLLGVLTLAG
ncbi:hypothetical protein [Mucilaginibacter mallensis]|nr:hypothetical protein [Mucilaginibacter mallensis]